MNPYAATFQGPAPAAATEAAEPADAAQHGYAADSQDGLAIEDEQVWDEAGQGEENGGVAQQYWDNGHHPHAGFTGYGAEYDGAAYRHAAGYASGYHHHNHHQVGLVPFLPWFEWINGGGGGSSM